MERDEAIKELELAGKMNPGPWIQHSYTVAKAAELITIKTNKNDPEKAFIYGLLHDIGRRNGYSYIKHVIDGYEYLKQKDRKAAYICLSHSFPNKDIREYQGIIDIDVNRLKYLEQELVSSDYDYYDKLIILMDSYCSVDQYVKLESRWIDVSIRYGVNSYTVEKWKKTYKIRDGINQEGNISIEEILGV
jgi:putative nucleotidyltransferase with HDIG domain